MGEIIKFKKPSLVAFDILSLATLARPCASQKKAEVKTLCISGFHNFAGSEIGRALARPKGESQGCGESSLENSHSEKIRRETGKAGHAATL
ncbi:MAG: hypothetical protein Tsb0026_03580 [Sulfuricaulis sp.]